MNGIEDPLNRPASFPYKKWLLRGFRFSIIVGGAFAVKDAIERYSDYQASVRSNIENRLDYECAARLDDPSLLAARNEFGNINVRKFFCSDRDFFVSMPEIADVRAGKMDFSTSLPAFDLVNTVVASVFGFLASITISAAALMIVVVVRWVW
ncbi:hypothetical protein [Sinorhizobium sp. BJ1]|uniref:hypothetical protein n=1 Tax=Sinorhizobium sp. BJ1 TaxID=2035455 RepID=UPI0011867F2D|nr:hypothetical protein [Sinorhizobium sp. BJ1]